MTPKNRARAPGLRRAAFAGLALGAAAAGAAVIPGTGATPGAARLGATDAVAFRTAGGGPGHLLLVPYFTVQDGQMSVLHLVNTDLGNGKAVKLRWRGAGNGDHLLSLQVLLAPGDVWTAVVTQGADGTAQLSTADHSCTQPRLAPGGAAQPFATNRLNPNHTAEVLKQHTREGTVEAIVMADIPSAAVYGPGADARSALSAAIRNPGSPSSCDARVLDDALLTDTGSEATAAARGLAAPTGGLAGSWYIIDVPGSTTFSGAATAIQAVNAAGRPARGNYVLFPQTADAVAAPEAYTADPVLVSAGLASRVKQADGATSSPTAAAVVRAVSYDLPDLSTPYYLPAQAVNARITAGEIDRLLAADSVVNQYAVDPSISAKTDWVFSLPTRRYSVGLDYAQPPAEARVFSVVPPADGSDNQSFHSGNTRVESLASPIRNNSEGAPVAESLRASRVCSADLMPMHFFDREENWNSSIGMFMAPSQKLNLCGAASVAAFSDTGASALGARVARETIVNGLFTNGWARFYLQGSPVSRGLPVLGAAHIKLTNPSAQPGVSGHYGISWPHSFKR